MNSNFRVERVVTSPLPHRPVRADFPHTVLPITASLKDSSDRYSYHSILYPSRYLHFNCLHYSYVTGTLSLVQLVMFLKCSSVIRQTPSLLGGFHGADFPPFKRYYELAKTAFAHLVDFGFLVFDTTTMVSFLTDAMGDPMYPQVLDYSGYGQSVSPFLAWRR